MPSPPIRAVSAVAVAVAIVILSVGGALAACTRCGCIPVKGCPVAPAMLWVEQGPPDYDALVTALEGPPRLHRYPYIRTWFGYPYWWTTRIVAVGPTMVRYRPNRRCYACEIPISR